jgi:hypothetical protein
MLTPNRKKHFLKSREGERNFEVIASSERISESNNLTPGLGKNKEVDRFNMISKQEKGFFVAS